MKYIRRASLWLGRKLVRFGQPPDQMGTVGWVIGHAIGGYLYPRGTTAQNFSLPTTTSRATAEQIARACSRHKQGTNGY